MNKIKAVVTCNDAATNMPEVHTFHNLQAAVNAKGKLVEEGATKIVVYMLDEQTGRYLGTAF